MLNTTRSTKYKVVNETDNLCSPRGTQNLVGKKHPNRRKEREVNHLHLVFKVNFYVLGNELYHSANKNISMASCCIKTSMYLFTHAVYLVIGSLPT